MFTCLQLICSERFGFGLQYLVNCWDGLLWLERGQRFRIYGLLSNNYYDRIQVQNFKLYLISYLRLEMLSSGDRFSMDNYQIVGISREALQHYEFGTWLLRGFNFYFLIQNCRPAQTRDHNQRTLSIVGETDSWKYRAVFSFC